MEIKVCTSNEIAEQEWTSFQENFNIVFNRNYEIAYFKNKYLNSVENNSYHSLLLNDEQKVVGACNVIPYNYHWKNQKIKIGLAVDVFIHEDYRTDPLMLRRLYMKLKKELISHKIVAVIAVPNDTVYSYWKNVVKWKDIGDINYWGIPINIGNILHKSNTLNFVSKVYFSVLLFVNRMMLFFINSKSEKGKISLDKNNDFYKYRYNSNDYSHIVENNFECYYRIVDEDGTKTAYLLEANEHNKVTYKALFLAVKNISKHKDVDLVLYVGQLRLFQYLFIKIPKKSEPKRLPLTCDFMDNDIDNYSDLLNIGNWNFGLSNYDVR